ncbi:MAG: PKD domain-containing protein [Thermoplasmata archaeon]|nr:PKD domain-containing protein [Thermoplasmata archaeon]
MRRSDGRVAIVALGVLALILLSGGMVAGGHAGGTMGAPTRVSLHELGGRGSPASGFGERFPAPQAGTEPLPAIHATPAVQRLLQHQTKVASLVANRGAGYTYGYGVALLAYAPWDQAFYVAVAPSSVDEILAGSTSTSAVIAVGTDPFGVAVDNATKQVWVTNFGSNNVTVIDGTTQAAVANIAVPSEPLGIAVNPSQGRVFVATNGTNATSVINATSYSLLRNVSVGVEPIGVVYDGATNRAFVSDYGSNQVSVLDGLTGHLLRNISVGSGPDGLAVDNATDTVYVANEGSQNVSVIAAASATLNATIPIVANGYFPDLQAVTYDSAHRMIWVTAGFSAVVINTTEERAVDEIVYDPAGIAYDPTNGDVCLTDSANVTFGCFTFGTYLQPNANVTFSETGLPAGSVWIVALTASPWFGDTVSQAISNASFVFGVDFWTHQPGYSYSYAIQPVAGVTPTPSQGTVANSGTRPSWVNVTFNFTGVYAVRFNGTGLPNGTGWSVNLNGSATQSAQSSIRFWLPNGTYAFIIPDPADYTSSPFSGSIQVNGSAVTVAVAFSATGSGGAAPGWTNITNGTSPSSRFGAAIAYDPLAGYTLFFGGMYGPYGWGSGRFGTNLNDTWTFANGVWTNITASAGRAPTPREFASLTYDSRDGYMLLVGGEADGNSTPRGCAGPCSDTWKFAQGQWTELPATLFTQWGFSAIYDSSGGYVLGIIRAEGISPTGTGGASVAYEGGIWVALGYNSTTNRTSPSPRYWYPALVDDPAAHGVLLIGGRNGAGGGPASNATWLFSNGSWTNLTGILSASPPRDSYPAATYDSATSQVVFVSTNTNLLSSGGTSTWGFNGTWTNLSSAKQPPSVGAASLTWDSADRSSLFFGGATEGGNRGSLNATWEWSANPNIVEVTLATSPAASEVGVAVTFNASWRGGAGAFTFAWTFGDGASSSLANPGHGYLTSGTFNVHVRVNDSGGDSAAQNISIVVNPALSLGLSVSNTNVLLGRSLSITAATSGGVGPLAYSYWGLPPGCAPVDAANLTCTPSRAAAYNISVSVRDSLGVNRSQSVDVDVLIPICACGPAPAGTSGPLTLLLIAGAGIALAIGVVTSVVLLRHRREHRP